VTTLTYTGPQPRPVHPQLRPFVKTPVLTTGQTFEVPDERAGMLLRLPEIELAGAAKPVIPARPTVRDLAGALLDLGLVEQED